MNNFQATVTYDDGSTTVQNVSATDMAEAMLKASLSAPGDGSTKVVIGVSVVFVNGDSL